MSQERQTPDPASEALWLAKWLDEHPRLGSSDGITWRQVPASDADMYSKAAAELRRLAAIPAPEGAQVALEGLFREAIDWGKSYGQRLSLSDTQVSDVCQSFAAQALRAALAAPAKAPCTHGAEHCTNTSCERLGECQYMAAPAPQAPVALTDYQIVRIYEQPELAGTRHESGTAKAIAIARAIERAHGIPAPKEPKA